MRSGITRIGVFAIELVGACWVSPELSEIGGQLVCTFEKLFRWESAHCHVDKPPDRPVFGELATVIPETFGQTGLITRVANQTAFRPSDHSWFAEKKKGVLAKLRKRMTGSWRDEPWVSDNEALSSNTSSCLPE